MEGIDTGTELLDDGRSRHVTRSCCDGDRSFVRPGPGDAPASHNAAHQPAVESAGCSFKASPHGRMRRNPCSGTAMMQRKGE